MRRGENLRAKPHKKRVQAMSRDEHLRARPRYLRAQPTEEDLQGMPAGGRLVQTGQKRSSFLWSDSARIGLRQGLLARILRYTHLTLTSK